MADKFLRNNAGTLTETEATVVSAGAGNAGDIVGLDSTGHLDTSVMPPGIGPDTKSITASEALSAGDLVNVWDDAGTAKVRKADASTTGKEAHAFVLAAVSSGASASCYLRGQNTQLTGQTAGPKFLSATTPGAVTSTAPSTAGQIVQRVGTCVSATELSFEPSQPMVLA